MSVPKYCCEVEPKNMPDMVAVVRCKDCVHYGKKLGSCSIHEGYGYDDDFFCACGKRKDGGKE